MRSPCDHRDHLTFVRVTLDPGPLTLGLTPLPLSFALSRSLLQLARAEIMTRKAQWESDFMS